MSISLSPEISALLNEGDLLVPAIAQDSLSGEVLMLAYVNRQSLALTISTGYATYFSRSRNELWKKGETSGHLQKIISISLDCDGDAILFQVEQEGVACHTGEFTCFHREVFPAKDENQEQ
ncbi:MAG: phosphoribosyl-AMP cyclohydrolase [Candidatus Planktophila sp.]